jgi:hypothetical protein
MLPSHGLTPSNSSAVPGPRHNQRAKQDRAKGAPTASNGTQVGPTIPQARGRGKKIRPGSPFCFKCLMAATHRRAILQDQDATRGGKC